MTKMIATCSIDVAVAPAVGVGVVAVLDQVANARLLNVQLIGRVLIAVVHFHRCSSACTVVASTT